MSRILAVISVCTLLIGIFVFANLPASGMCHGGCMGPPVCPTPIGAGGGEHVATIVGATQGDSTTPTAVPPEDIDDASVAVTPGAELTDDGDGAPAATPIGYVWRTINGGVGGESTSNLAYYKLELPGPTSALRFVPGESAVISVVSGTVELKIPSDSTQDSIQVLYAGQELPDVVPLGESIELTSGDTLFVDRQDYADRDLLIAYELPEGGEVFLDVYADEPEGSHPVECSDE